jgi:putative endonuclease
MPRIMKNGYVYIVTNKPFGTLYIGVTSDLVKRIWEHREKLVEGFTKRYGLNRLVYYEVHERIDEAIYREKQMKEWNRNWKLRQIMEMNPDWKDLYEQIAC